MEPLSSYEYESNYDKSTTYSRLVMDYIRSMYHLPVEDKTGDMEAQRNGIDFTFDDKTAEFKTCDKIHKTGNVAFEIVSNSRKGTPGCCLQSKARFLFYFDTVNSVCHVMNLPQLRMAIELSDKVKWEAYKVTTKNRRGEILYATFGLLVPLGWIVSHPFIKYRRLNVAGYFPQWYTNAAGDGR